MHKCDALQEVRENTNEKELIAEFIKDIFVEHWAVI